MPGTLALLAAALWAAALQGDTRYGIPADLRTYPQGTPQEALASALKAADAGRFDYLAAQLADPQFIDERVRRLYGGQFEQQVEDTRDRLDPGTVKLLRRFLSEGTWTTQKDEATVALKDVPDRGVYLRRVDGRWYLENRSGPPPSSPRK
jgi:hypothetical protein